MKIKDLQEIFEPSTSEINTGGYHRFDGIPDDPGTGRELGRGTFSRASEDDSDPHMVTKTQMRKKSPHLTDVFDDYAEIVSDEKLWNMVHFPRVYATKKYVDEHGDVKHRWSMEKLIPLNHPSVNKRDIKALSERYFSQGSYEEIEDEGFHISEFVYILDIALAEQHYDLIKDPTLKKACKKLMDIYFDLGSVPGNYVELDIHDENLMFRRSQHGLDVIFSDPFVQT